LGPSQVVVDTEDATVETEEAVLTNDCKTQQISELTTVSDEALALLLLDNMWDKWIDHDPKEFFGPGERDETGKQKQAISVCGKYTKNGSGSKKFKGWSKC